MRLSATAIALLLLAAASPLAQTPGNCDPGTASADLDISDVRATLLNNGNLFYGPADGGFVQSAYVVPKESGNTAIFAANLWVGGTVGGELRVAAATFLDFDLWPGPLEDGATLPDPDDCSDWDRIWVVSTLDVQAYDATGIATADLAEWPAELGAEVVDGDGVSGNYNLAGGDRPRIYGSQTAFWVMNDVGNEHVRSESEPIGLEVQATAFAISSPDAAFDQATFYRYRLVNRNTLPLEDARLSVWADTDMGDVSDEYEGVDTTRGLGYYYNASETDSRYGVPPAAGFDFLGAGLGSFRYATNSSGPLSDPRLKIEIDRTQRGLWNDGTPQTASGIGYGTDGPVTVWAFPGDPVANECWSNTNNCEGGANSGGNHRIIPTAPPFSLQPGEARMFDIAFLFAQGTSNLDSITELRAASDRVQAAYDDGSLFDARLPVASEGHAANPSTLRLHAVYPNPARDRATVAFSLAEPGPVRLAVYDVLGRRVRTLAEGPLAAGDHTTAFDAAGLPIGIYLVVLEAGGGRQAQKVMLVR
ncbi:MAG: T9SS type A sorting domain-containing protein [Rhodothermales bacterium]